MSAPLRDMSREREKMIQSWPAGMREVITLPAALRTGRN
jgi:hypothetical protein